MEYGFLPSHEAKAAAHGVNEQHVVEAKGRDRAAVVPDEVGEDQARAVVQPGEGIPLSEDDGHELVGDGLGGTNRMGVGDQRNSAPAGG